MTVTLYHHPWSRAAGTIWPLEECGVEYTLEHVDLMKGEQKESRVAALNPMGKVPVLVDGDTVVTEAAAIALYLADRYAPGTLAPALDDPKRGAYLRWAFFGPSVVEPAVMAKLNEWKYKDGQAGWGTYAATLDTMESALSGGDYLLGDTFSMADVVLGGTLRWFLKFGTIEPRSAFTAYVERLNERPALKKADAINEAIIEERGLGQ